MSPTPARPKRVLVVDDAEGIRSYLATLLELRGYSVDTARDGMGALALLESGAAPDVVLLDVMLPGMDGLATLDQIRERDPDLPVVMLSVVGKASTIVEAMRRGASDYLNKPFEEDELDLVLTKALEARALRTSRRALQAEEQGPGGDALWSGPALRSIEETLTQIADTDVTVLIQGESGVGKEVVARRLHATSNRAKATFVKVNCAALPGELLESELFGYEKGAFTGATARKPGRFEIADKGTIFLDEIGEMSPAAQAKLLQVLQDGTFSRLGGNRELRVDVRVISATNRPLQEMVDHRGFREDLYFRLNVVGIRIPPLRERRDEIPGMVEHFLVRSAARYERPVPELSPEVLAHFEHYSFPGNVRELENMIKRVVVLQSEDRVLSELRGENRTPSEGPSAFQALLDEVEQTAGELPLREVGRRASHEAERQAIERMLSLTGWNRKRAASLLGVSYKTLLQKIRDCGLSEP